jgi:hypothetical protein
MLDDPVGQRPLKADVVAGFLRLDPLVLENLLAFSLELAVKRGVLQQIASRWFFGIIRHSHYEFGKRTLRRGVRDDNQKTHITNW